ncbi:MAG: peptidoglycan-binding domain-containing protein, partial [Clostridia bacterium]|nr:peptidoglycan-binding domain-containing protein [Clostridia bacterium]
GTGTTGGTGTTFVKLILSSANLRATPNGTKKEEWTGIGSTLEVTGAVEQAGGYSWYPVAYQGKVLYVRGDCVQLIGSGTTPAPGETAAPGVTPTPAPVTGDHVQLILSSVNLRNSPAGERVGEWVGKGTTMPLAGKAEVKNGFTWYPIKYTDGKLYYVRADCVAVTSTPVGPISTNTPVSGSYGSVTTVVSNVNFRSKPAGTRIAVVDKGVTLALTGPGVVSGAYTWYPVVYNGKAGYLRSDCVSVKTSGGDTPTAAPTTVTGQTVTITMSSVNFRKEPAGAKIGTLDKGKQYPMAGSSVSKGGYTWYPITVAGVKGYVRSDCASVSGGSGGGGSTPGTPSSYVITILDKVNLRASASKDSKSIEKVSIGTQMQYNTSKTVGGSLWYRVIYKNQEVWVLGTCVRVMTQEELGGGGGGTVTPAPTSTTGLGTVRTTMGGVNVRKTPGGASMGQVDRGQTFSFTKTENYRGYTWYYVSTKYGMGWLRSDCVERTDNGGSDAGDVTPPPSGSGEANVTTNPNEGKTEASYTTLKKGDSGTNVKNLVTALKNKGYYTGSITSSYTSAVETAVKKFQTANGLYADGIAGPDTQHKLYGTVPVGSTSASDIIMPIYPAEKINWFTGGIQSMWPKGANVMVYDVKTGIVWWAHRWSGGNHADVEPLTAADSARLCRIYGVSNTQEIADKNMWRRRPCLVTIGNRTFACSLYGVPHNYPKGDTIANNDMKGQICIHFTGSKTHAGDQVDSGHAEAIEYAWQNALNGHK